MIPLECKTELILGTLPEEDEWELKAPLIWKLRGGYELTTPAGFITDLASIPRLFQNILSVTGRSRRAAVAHDWLYCSHLVSRKEADEFLRHALVCEGMSRAVAWLYWAGVHIGGSKPWNENNNGVEREDFVDEAAFSNYLANRSRYEQLAIGRS